MLRSTRALVAALVYTTLAIAAIIFCPLITIWAVNKLFSTTIPFTIGTWFAALWLSVVVSGSATSVARRES